MITKDRNVDLGWIMRTQELRRQLQASIAITSAIGEAIRDLKQVPNGQLYASIFGAVSLESYTRAIDCLKQVKLVREEAHILTWIGS